METKEKSKLNLWLEKKLYFPGLSDKQLQGNINVFANHIFLSFYNSDTIHCFIDFCSPGYTFYPLYDCIQQSLCFIAVISTFIPQTLHGYPYLYQYDDVPADILLHYRMGGIATSAGLFLQVFPMF